MKETSLHPSNSKEQIEAEFEIIGQLAHSLGVKLQPTKVKADSEFQIDGFYLGKDRVVAAEAFSRTEKIKDGQRKKILSDMTKLVELQNQLGRTVDKYLVFADARSANAVTSGWRADYAKRHDIRVYVAKPSKEIVEKLNIARVRQAQGVTDGKA